MTYNEWRDELKNNLLSVTEAERNRVLDYYAEAYADRREAGFSEREIIEDFGAPYDAAQRILGLSQDDDEHYSKQPQRELSSRETKAPNSEPKSGKSHLAAKIVLPIVAVVIVAVFLGVILLGVITDWALTFSVDWEEHKFECSDTISDIDIEFSAGTLQIEFYDGKQIEVEYYSCNRFTTNFTATNGTLRMSTSPTRWNNVFLWFNKIPETKMYIPRSWQVNFDVVINAGAVTFAEGGNYGNISIELNAGAISMRKVNCLDCNLEVNAGSMNLSDLYCNKLTCEVNAGAAEVNGLKCDDISIEVSAGAANIGIIGQKSQYTIRVDKSAGSCNVTNQIGTDANKVINIDVSAGAANVTFSN